MMKWLKEITREIKEIKSTPKQLREFGIVFLVFFLILGTLAYFRHKNFVLWMALAGIFGILAFVRPSLLLPLQKVWMAFAVIMGWFMSRLILGVLFFLVLTPLSLIAKLSGKKLLDREFHKPGDSYWISRDPAPTPKERYLNQF